MSTRLERFRDKLLPYFQKELGENFVVINEHAKNIKFYDNKNGKQGKVKMQYYPIGNILQVDLRWIREDSFKHLCIELLGQERPDLHEIMHPGELPKIKLPNYTVKKKELQVEKNKLCVVGDKFSEQNLKIRKTAACVRMEKLLNESGIPFIAEYPVVIKESAEKGGQPKLYVLDFLIPPPFNFVIEVDGGYHTEEEQIRYDQQRDRSLSAKGVGGTIRVKNEEVLHLDFNLIRFLMKSKIFKTALSRYRNQLAIRKF